MDPLKLYPTLAILAELMYFVLGHSYWGYCYAFGSAFFLLALLMPLHLRWAPLEFGSLWAVCLVVIAVRLRKLAVTTNSGGDSRSK